MTADCNDLTGRKEMLARKNLRALAENHRTSVLSSSLSLPFVRGNDKS